MPAYFESGASINPMWHGLGNRIDGDLLARIQNGEVPTDELLALAGLNWTVQRRAIAMRPGNGDRSVMLTSQLDAFRAIVRSDTDEVFQVASNRYHPVQNKDVVEFFVEYCNAGHATIETLGSLKGGAVVWCLARLNGGSTKTIGGTDEMRGYMLLATSHDGTVTTTGKPTQVCVVCWNTLQQSLGEKYGKENTFKMRHSRRFNLEAKSEAQRVMGMAVEQIAYTNDIAEKLSKVRVDAAGRLEFLDRVLKANGSMLDAIVESQQPTGSVLDAIVEATDSTSDEDKLSRVGKACLEAILTSPGSELESRKNTMWGNVNGITWFADHVAKARSNDNRVYNAWFGTADNSGAQLKQRAMQTAIQMSGIAV